MTSKITTTLPLLLLLLLSVHAAWPGESTARHILIVNSYDSHSSPYVRPSQVFRKTLQDSFADPISFREFNLETNWGREAQDQTFLIQVLEDLFLDPAPDLVVAIGPPAVAFWVQHRDRLSQRAPLIATAGEERFSRAQLGPGDAAVVTPVPFADFIDDILLLAPGTSHIVMVFGHSQYERNLARIAEEQLHDHASRIDFEYTYDMTLEEIETLLSRLGRSSAVFYGVFNYDAAGFTMGYGSGLGYVRAASKAPVFGFLDEQMGNGIVGGRLLDLEGLGKRMAEAAALILEDRAGELGWQRVDRTAPIYDWRELRTWEIPTDILPAGSQVRFRPTSPLEQYLPWVLVGASILAVQSLLIAYMLIERRRRRRLEQVQANLSGRLITAHEDERRRIARELHDDVSQRLARLSMDAVTLRSRGESDDLSDELASLQSGIAGVSKDLHDMSYRLHPSLLDDLGVSAALREECRQFDKHAGARIVERIEDVTEPVPKDTALCIYRVGQEALRNAVRHAESEHIEVALRKEGEMLVLTVEDDGCGFSYSASEQGTGLGISSMTERARQLDGVFSINSSPGKGTRVTLELPLKEAGS